MEIILGVVLSGLGFGSAGFLLGYRTGREEYKELCVSLLNKVQVYKGLADRKVRKRTMKNGETDGQTT